MLQSFESFMCSFHEIGSVLNYRLEIKRKEKSTAYIHEWQAVRHSIDYYDDCGVKSSAYEVIVEYRWE